jgi:hypothetical protein
VLVPFVLVSSHLQIHAESELLPAQEVLCKHDVGRSLDSPGLQVAPQGALLSRFIMGMKHGNLLNVWHGRVH